MNKYLLFLGDAYSGHDLISIHNTLEEAVAAVPDKLKVIPINALSDYFMITELHPDNTFEDIADERITALF